VGQPPKRLPPKPVPPISADGIRYSAEGDGKDSYVAATDEATGKTLWKVKVFHTRIKFWRGEEDNQWVFISDLKLAGDSVLVRDENNRCYSISLNTKHVKKAACGNAFPPQEPRT
jgi:outer membrane protein assembly factor BamB